MACHSVLSILSVCIKSKNMKTIISFLVTLLVTVSAKSQDSLHHEVLLETQMGNIRISLYNETPLHRDNFMKLVKSGFYDGLLFHRVISSFMIQTGDSASRDARPEQLLGDSPESYKIPAEIHYPQFFHKRGALGAAREPDAENPERQSSMSQFYIVYGRRFTEDQFDALQDKLSAPGNSPVQVPRGVKDAYLKYGGTPHLDGQYTVFGEVVEGLDVVRDIQWVETDSNDRPLEDIRIVRAIVVK